MQVDNIKDTAKILKKVVDWAKKKESKSINVDELEFFVKETINKITPKSKNSYATWGNYEFRPPTYIDGHFNPDEYDLVLWVKCEPFTAHNASTHKFKKIDKYCFSIAKLIWNEREGYPYFESVGLRYFENYEDGLNEFVFDFANKIIEERRNREEC